MQANRFSLLHLWTAWDGYGVRMKGILEQISPEFRNVVAFGSVKYGAEQISEYLRQLIS